jgi:uncharacterized protein (DUF58 family)
MFLGVSAANTGNNLVYMIVSALLGFMSLSGIFGRNNLSRVSVEVEFPEEIFARRDVPVGVVVTNLRRKMPIFLLRVRVGDSTVSFPYLDGGQRETRYLTTNFQRRGRHEISGITVSSVFPFNFFIRFRYLSRQFSCIVFPELKKEELLGGNHRERKVRGERTSDKIGHESDIISIREYAYGDPLKYINWKATAKTGKLKTKELSAPSSRPVVIDFDRVLIRDLEERISVVAYTIHRLIRRNVPVGLRIAEKRYDPGLSKMHKVGMLRELALYDSHA